MGNEDFFRDNFGVVWFGVYMKIWIMSIIFFIFGKKSYEYSRVGWGEG